MPLWTTTSEPEQSVCGCAFSSDGRPWVAQRVWPMPSVPATGLLTQDRLEVLHAAGGAADLERPVLQDGHARGVVAAVLELLQAVDDDADRALLTDVADDSTHRSAFLLLPGGTLRRAGARPTRP